MTNRPTEQQTDQPTDGQTGSEGSYTSNMEKEGIDQIKKIKLKKALITIDGNKMISYLRSYKKAYKLWSRISSYPLLRPQSVRTFC